MLVIVRVIPRPSVNVRGDTNVTIKDLLEQFAGGQYNNQIREAILPLLGTLLDLFHDNTTAGDVVQHVRDAVDPTLDDQGLIRAEFQHYLDEKRKREQTPASSDVGAAPTASPPPAPVASSTTEGSLLS